MLAAVERAIATMWDRYREPLSLSDMADAALLSRFHFSRVFRSITGTSPCRYLAAVRLYKAKTLLLETAMGVIDIAYEVGYNSLGAFTSRFTRSVGLPPARYRLLCQEGTLPMPPIAEPRADRRTGIVRGLVTVPEAEVPLRLYVAAFDSAIAEGLPAACAVLDSPGPFRLDAVPHGAWHIKVAAVPLHEVGRRPRIRHPTFVGASGPHAVRGTGAGIDVGIELHRHGLLDLPILLALPDLDGAGRPGAAPRTAAPSRLLSAPLSTPLSAVSAGPEQRIR
jgi:AraC-like DNA-binding protein